MIDLRSDYYRESTKEMTEAMLKAASETAGFGLREDLRVSELEAYAAAWLGKEDALFLPTCTMANQAAIHLHCRRGDGFVAEADSHVITSEAGAPAALSGATAMPVPGISGQLNVATLAAYLAEPFGDISPSPRLLVLENTHTRHGGVPMTAELTKELCVIARRHRLSTHLDGARLINACVALDCEPIALCAPADSVSLSLNKGLGAPLGAILAGSKDFIRDAMRVRQRLGGGWRTAGIPAVAALVALKSGYARLAQVHINAYALAVALSDCPLVSVTPEAVKTNILLLRMRPGAPDAVRLVSLLAAHGVLALSRGRQTLRLVLHSAIDRREVDVAAEIFMRIAAEQTRAGVFISN